MNTKILEQAMSRALELAMLGPAKGVNPQVGAVILNPEGEIVSEGFHKGSGTPHAEVEAIKALETKIGLPFPAGYTAVVTLEPCNHTGKTGPCSQALIEAGISRVAFATQDPGHSSGGGAETLRQAGIEVIEGVLESEARDQARVWLLYSKSANIDGVFVIFILFFIKTPFKDLISTSQAIKIIGEHRFFSHRQEIAHIN